MPGSIVGNYFDIRKLARPKSYEFTPVTLADDPDFNKKSVRGTIVLRWEYVRGSTLFMVWNLATSDEDARKSIFSPWRDLPRRVRRLRDKHVCDQAQLLVCAVRYKIAHHSLRRDRCAIAFRFC
jgi:hypothetical protein